VAQSHELTRSGHHPGSRPSSAVVGAQRVATVFCAAGSSCTRSRPPGPWPLAPVARARTVDCARWSCRLRHLSSPPMTGSVLCRHCDHGGEPGCASRCGDGVLESTAAQSPCGAGVHRSQICRCQRQHPPWRRTHVREQLAEENTECRQPRPAPAPRQQERHQDAGVRIPGSDAGVRQRLDIARPVEQQRVWPRASASRDREPRLLEEVVVLLQQLARRDKSLDAQPRLAGRRAHQCHR
jgi:hypothetical protein